MEKDKVKNLTLDAIIERAIPIVDSDCKIKRAQKEALRAQTKRDIAVLIAKNFFPRPSEEKLSNHPDGDSSQTIPVKRQ